MTTEKEINFYALKTIFGGVHYYLQRYEERSQMSVWDWEYIRGYIGIPAGTVYGIEELNKTYLVLKTKEISIKYVHSEFHEERIIKIQKNLIP